MKNNCVLYKFLLIFIFILKIIIMKTQKKEWKAPEIKDLDAECTSATTGGTGHDGYTRWMTLTTS